MLLMERSIRSVLSALRRSNRLITYDLIRPASTWHLIELEMSISSSRTIDQLLRARSESLTERN